MSVAEAIAREKYWTARAAIAAEADRLQGMYWLVLLLLAMNDASDALKSVGLHPLDLEKEGPPR